VAGNSETILTRELYKAKLSTENGIAPVQKNCALDARYGRKESTNGKHYFKLRAGNHQVIGASEMYATVASRDAGIESVKDNA
jgi:hypothetical protein